jgi:hypothetical protein
MKTFQVKVKTQYRFAGNVNIIMLFEEMSDNPTE